MDSSVLFDRLSIEAHSEGSSNFIVSVKPEYSCHDLTLKGACYFPLSFPLVPSVFLSNSAQDCLSHSCMQAS
jgi:hypothetical protein